MLRVMQFIMVLLDSYGAQLQSQVESRLLGEFTLLLLRASHLPVAVDRAVPASSIFASFAPSSNSLAP